MIEICTVGGYGQVGRNMTAVKYRDEVVVFDMGLELESYIAYTEAEEGDVVLDLSAKKLTEIEAIPDIKLIEDWRKQVIAIVPSHAHLDHIGAIPFLSNRFECEIICTPFTKAVIEAICKDERIKLKNPIVPLPSNSKYQLSKNLTLEFIHITHSTPQTALVVLHTPEGAIVYANDFKLDNAPTLGRKPNYPRIEALGKENVKCLFIDSLYSRKLGKTPSETVAKEMLKQVLLETNTEGKAILVTTFSSHLARLKSIVEMGNKLNRNIVFLGRSLGKYVRSGENVGIVDFTKEVTLYRYGRQIRARLKQLEKKKHELLFVVTGHQGEQRSVLSRMARGILPFKLDPEDYVVFSTNIIPTETNRANREHLETQLKQAGARIFTNVHVSGHGSREDHRELVSMIRPKHVIPSHCNMDMAQGMSELCQEMGYKPGETIHLMENGARITLE